MLQKYSIIDVQCPQDTVECGSSLCRSCCEGGRWRTCLAWGVSGRGEKSKGSSY